MASQAYAETATDALEIVKAPDGVQVVEIDTMKRTAGW
jgi:hypothetical protein